MFRSRTIVALVTTGLLTSGLLAGCSSTSGSTGASSSSPAVSAASDSDAVEAVLTALTGPDGEYAAYAAYTAVIEEYGDVEPYVSIRDQEARHIAALTRQLQRLGVAVPANDWLAKIEAPASLEEAANAWAEGERVNILMYDDLLAQVDGDPMLTRVFTNLRRSSLEHHLPMFEAAAKAGGTL